MIHPKIHFIFLTFLIFSGIEVSAAPKLGQRNVSYENPAAPLATPASAIQVPLTTPASVNQEPEIPLASPTSNGPLGNHLDAILAATKKNGPAKKPVENASNAENDAQEKIEKKPEKNDGAISFTPSLTYQRELAQKELKEKRENQIHQQIIAQQFANPNVWQQQMYGIPQNKHESLFQRVKKYVRNPDNRARITLYAMPVALGVSMFLDQYSGEGERIFITLCGLMALATTQDSNMMIAVMLITALIILKTYSAMDFVNKYWTALFAPTSTAIDFAEEYKEDPAW